MITLIAKQDDLAAYPYDRPDNLTCHEQDELVNNFTCHELKYKLFRFFRFAILILALIFIFSGCKSKTDKPDQPTEQTASYINNDSTLTGSIVIPSSIEITAIPTSPTVVTPAMTEELQAAEDSDISQVNLLAVGDNLIHIQVVKSGKQADGSYNYDHLYSNLKEEISAADIAIINQETIFGGDEFDFSGYPKFSSPTEIGDAIVTAGFDVVLHATNHTMDKGLDGLMNTVDYWKLHPEITVLGINESEEEREQIKIIEKNGIKIAMLNYTYGLNGNPVPEDMPYLVNLLDKSIMEEDIKKAKELSDFVIVFPHWGTEYIYEASKSQADLTTFFYDLGVDLVIGTHPHVLEPVEWIETNKEHRMLVYYSLGNFISYQREAPRMLGGIANITIKKDASGTYISEAGITPIVTHYENGPVDYNYGIYKLTQYTQSLASQHGILNLETEGAFTYQRTFDLAEQVLGSWFQHDFVSNPFPNKE